MATLAYHAFAFIVGIGIAAGPIAFVGAIITGEWRWLLVTAASSLLLYAMLKR